MTDSRYVRDGFTAKVEWLTAEYEPALQTAVRGWITQQLQDHSEFARTWLSATEADDQARFAVTDALTALGGWKRGDRSMICQPW